MTGNVPEGAEIVGKKKSSMSGAIRYYWARPGYSPPPLHR